MNGPLTVSFLLLGIQLGMSMPTNSLPAHERQQPMANEVMAEAQRSPAAFPTQSDFDYSRFYFGNNIYDKKSAQAPIGYGPLSQQWYAGSLPRQLAPKFKRDFGSYGSHDKRMDDALLEDFYSMKPDRFEWNFNRL